MANVTVNGVKLAYDVAGEGPPLVLVHGSWGDRHNWDAVFDSLARTFRVIRYDRRGHSESERPATQGSFEEDAADLGGIIQALGLDRAHVVGNSGGAAIALKLAAKRPELFRSLAVHEPPLFGVLVGAPTLAPVLAGVKARIGKVVSLLEASKHEDAARTFVEEIAFGPGAWATLPEPLRQTFIFNAPTFLDEQRDRDGVTIDLSALGRFHEPTLVTDGDASPPFFRAIVGKLAEALPRATRFTFEGAGHVPHLSHAPAYVKRVSDHITAAN